MANMGAISVDILANTRQFERNMAKVQKTMANVGSKMQDIGKKMTASITLPILAVGAAALKSAMDLEATEAKYKAVFGNMTKEADGFIKKFKELTPITTAAARSMVSGIQDLLVPMGFLREDATKLTGEFTHLIGALTNFNSATHSAEDVANAFQSALTGEYTPLKRLGIQLDVTTMKAKALEMGLIKEGQELTRQQKVLVLLSQAYKQSGDALSAYNKENLDTLTKLKLLTTKLQDTSAELAVKFLPTVIKIIDKLNALADRFSNLSPTMQKTIVVVGAIAAAIGPLLMIIGGLISSVSTIATVLAAVSAPALGVVAAIAGVIAVLVAAWKTNEKFRGTIKKVWGKIYKTISKVAKSVMGVVGTLWEVIKAFWEQFGGLISTVLGAALNVVADVFSGIGSIIGGAFNVIQGALQIFLGLFTGNWRKAWEGIISITQGALKIVNGLLKGLGFEIEGIQTAIDKLGQTQKKQTTAQMGRGPFSKGGRANINSGPFKRDIKQQTNSVDDLIGSFDDLGSVGVSTYDKLADATEKYVDMLKSQIDTFKTAFGIFDKPMIERISGERLLVRMEAQTKVFEKWQKALDVLRQKLGAGSKLFQQLAQQGPQSAGQIIGLAGLSTEQLRKAEQLQATRGQIATGVATGLVSQQIRNEQMQPTVNLNGGVYVGDMAELANLIAKEMKLANSY